MKKHHLLFPRRLSDSRLGEKHNSLDAFHRAAQHSGQSVRESKEYSLVVVTETRAQTEMQTSTTNETRSESGIFKPNFLRRVQNTRILLGMKHRGFGRGFYSSFGGKFLNEKETAETCACRVLEEETNLKVRLDEMTKSEVGIQRYTFENDPVEMIMHVFRIHLEKTSANKVGSYNVTGCDEITPIWYEDIDMIPLDNMIANDSLWLTALLSSSVPMKINGSYQFKENCKKDTNTILHYYLDIQPKKSDFSLEQRLFHTLHDNQSNLLSIKEFKECYAFCNAVRTAFSNKNRKNDTFDIVIDVCGGHGALAALFLICTPASLAIVIDPANVGGGRIQQAWGSKFMSKEKKLMYRRECLRTGLPDELEQALKMTTRNRILVVACHACQHLSEEILQKACKYGVHVAVMPCCQKDRSPGSTWKAVSKNLSVPVAKVMDILQCGKIMALGSHTVRLKCIDSRITPQNRIIVCRALSAKEISQYRHQDQNEVDKAHSKLESVYRKAHAVPDSRNQLRNVLSIQNFVLPSSVWYVAVGFVVGVVSAGSFRKK